MDLRERVVRWVESGASCRAAAATFAVSVSFVVKLMQRWRRRGTVAPDRYGGWKRSPLVAHADRVLALVAARPDLVFIAETWATTTMARSHGRARRGQRLVAAVPHGHWQTSTFLAALRQDRITAPCVCDGAINGERLRADVEQALAPTLEPGDVVIMDNLGAHKVAGVREAIEVRGAHLLYLPPYSPDLNPIEQVFAKLKTLLRTAAKRTVAALWHALGQALDAFTPAEFANYLAHAGDVPSHRKRLALVAAASWPATRPR